MSINYNEWIGKKVTKDSKKPFKSKNKENTVVAVTTHPILKIPSFTFAEDDSIVEARQCQLVKESVND